MQNGFLLIRKVHGNRHLMLKLLSVGCFLWTLFGLRKTPWISMGFLPQTKSRSETKIQMSKINCGTSGMNGRNGTKKKHENPGFPVFADQKLQTHLRCAIWSSRFLRFDRAISKDLLTLAIRFTATVCAPLNWRKTASVYQKEWIPIPKVTLSGNPSENRKKNSYDDPFFFLRWSNTLFTKNQSRSLLFREALWRKKTATFRGFFFGPIPLHEDKWTTWTLRWNSFQLESLIQ